MGGGGVGGGDGCVARDRLNLSLGHSFVLVHFCEDFCGVAKSAFTDGLLPTM